MEGNVGEGFVVDVTFCSAIIKFKRSSVPSAVFGVSCWTRIRRSVPQRHEAAAAFHLRNGQKLDLV